MKTRPQRAVFVLLVCGRPGRVSVHPLEACYPGASYEFVAPPLWQALPLESSLRPGEFWMAMFHKLDPVAPLGEVQLQAWPPNFCRRARPLRHWATGMDGGTRQRECRLET